MSRGHLPFIDWLESQLDRIHELVAIVYMQSDPSILQCNVRLAVVQRHLIQDQMLRQRAKSGYASLRIGRSQNNTG